MSYKIVKNNEFFTIYRDRLPICAVFGLHAFKQFAMEVSQDLLDLSELSAEVTRVLKVYELTPEQKECLAQIGEI